VFLGAAISNVVTLRQKSYKHLQSELMVSTH